MTKITKEDFYKILDYLDIKPEDTYGNVKLFEKELEEKGKVFRTYAGDTDVNIVQIEDVNIVIDTLKFTIPALRDSRLNITDIKRAQCKVYDRMVGGYVDIKLLVSNICKSLGVILDDNIEYVNPDLYNGILRKVLGFYNNTEDLTKMPFGCEKKGDDYKTYYPAWVIYEVGSYLSSEGVFETQSDYPNITPLSNIGYDMSNAKLTSISSMKGLLKEFLDTYNAMQLTEEYKANILHAFDVIVNTYSPSENNILCVEVYNITGTNFNIQLREFIKHVQFTTGFYNKNYTFGTTTTTIRALETFTYKIYNITQALTPSVISNEIAENAVFSFGNANNYNLQVYNLDISESFKKYFNVATTDWNQSLGIISYNDILNNVSLLDKDAYGKQLLLGRGWYEKLIEHYNIDIEDNDLVLSISNNTYDSVSKYTTRNYTLYVIKNCKDYIKIVGNYQIETFRNLFNNSVFRNNTIADNKYRVYTQISTAGNMNDAQYANFEFDGTKEIKGYNLYEDGTYADVSYESNHFELKTLYNKYQALNYQNWISCNIGVFNIVKPSTAGITLESGADYPINLNSYDAFMSHYRGWYADVEAMRGLTYDRESKELIGTTDAHWLPLAMSKINTQAEAQDALITDSNVEGIITDIEEGDDPDRPDAPSDPDSPPTTDPEQQDEGDTPDIDHAPLQAINGTGIRQYVLTAKQLQDFLREINTPNLIDLTVGQVFGPPKDYIISLVQSKIYSASANSYAMTVGPYNFETQANLNILNYNRVNCGQIDINPYFNNYNDYDSTTVELFLPYVGFVGLDIKDFIGGKIKLWATCDTLSGVICYYVYSIRNGATQIKATYSGNFLAQIPLASYDYTQIASSLINVGATVAGLLI